VLLWNCDDDDDGGIPYSNVKSFTARDANWWQSSAQLPPE